MKRLVVVSALVLSACAAQPALVKNTGSGNAETTFRNVSPDRVKNEIVVACMKTGAEVTSDQYSVTCAKRNDGTKGMMAQALLGNGFSQTPWEKLRFTIAPTGNDVFVTAVAWMEMTMGFGEVKRIPYDGNAMQNQMQTMLDAAASRLAANQGPQPAPSTSAPAPSPPSDCKSCGSVGREF